MAAKPAPLGNLLKGNGLAAIKSAIAEHAVLLADIRRILPDFLSSHCVYCVGRGENLVIYAESAAWASQLRFYVPSITAALRTPDGRNFREVLVRNILSGVVSPTPKRERPPASPLAAETVLGSAEYISDAELKKAMGRLGATLKKRR